MAKLTDIRFNVSYIKKDDGTMLKMTELILLTSKPSYRQVESNQVEKHHKIKEHRIEVTDNDLEVLILALNEIKDVDLLTPNAE